MLCRGYGLTIDTAFELPGATTGVSVQDPVDLTIVEGELAWSESAATRGAYSFVDDRLRLTVPQIGRFELDGACRLTVEPDPAASHLDVSDLLLASALPMVLWRRGGVLLHAGGVQFEAGRAVAIAGPSGSGKSTLARLLVEGGARLIGDDTLWIDDGSADEIVVRGLSGGRFVGSGSGDRRFEAVRAEQQTPEARLAAIVALSRDAPPGLRRPEPLLALQALLRNRHRPNVPALLGRDAAVLAQCTAIAARLPIYELGLVEGKPEAAAQAVAGLA